MVWLALMPSMPSFRDIAAVTPKRTQVRSDAVTSDIRTIQRAGKRCKG
jgi:hypothetical protein